VFDDEVEDKLETETNLARLERFIQGLKEIDRSIMLLYLEDKSYREIAQIVGISDSNVATKINRIKIILKSKFTQE
jgi:RNA polymerase sigma-70 factor (ECF subfamily)